MLLISLSTISMAQEEKKEPVTFSEVVSDFVQTLQKAGSKITDTASELETLTRQEIPLIIQEYLNWHFCYNFLISVLCVLLIPAMWISHRKIYKNGDVADSKIVVGVIMALATVICVIVFFHHTEWIKVAVAPRVFLLDNFSQVIK